MNIRENLKNTKQCECCGKRIKVKSNRVKYCDSCLKNHIREQKKDWAKNNKNPEHKSQVNLLNKGYIGNGIYKSSINGKTTKQYSTWKSMMHRCYSQKYHSREKTYINCEVCEEWLNFQNFAKWYDENYYEINGEVMCLDKDILVKGNKLYSPKTCIFVPKSINSLFIKSNAKRGDLPIGVKYNRKENKYYAGLNKNNKKYHLGIFDNPIDAFYSYQKAKEDYIKEVANNYISVIPNKLYNALINYKVEITD